MRSLLIVATLLILAVVAFSVVNSSSEDVLPFEIEPCYYLPIIESVPTPAPEPSPSATSTRSPFPFTKDQVSPQYLQNFANPAGCNWMGIAGEVFDIQGNPVQPGEYRVHVWDSGIDSRVNMLAMRRHMVPAVGKCSCSMRQEYRNTMSS